LSVKQARYLRNREGFVGRHSDSAGQNYYPEHSVKLQKRGKWHVKHPPQTVIQAIRLANQVGYTKAAQILGLKNKTVKSWHKLRFLPKTGKYTFDQMMRLVRLARNLYLINQKALPMKCLKDATDAIPEMKWSSVKVFLVFEAMPTVPGFPLYADRMVNQKAEDYGSGLRKYSSVLGVDAPGNPPVVVDPVSRKEQTGQRIAPRQLGRRFAVESRVTSLIPRRHNDLL